jgi:hypothetical protein
MVLPTLWIPTQFSFFCRLCLFSHGTARITSCRAAPVLFVVYSLQALRVAVQLPARELETSQHHLTDITSCRAVALSTLGRHYRFAWQLPVHCTGILSSLSTLDRHYELPRSCLCTSIVYSWQALRVAAQLPVYKHCLLLTGILSCRAVAWTSIVYSWQALRVAAQLPVYKHCLLLTGITSCRAVAWTSIVYSWRALRVAAHLPVYTVQALSTIDRHYELQGSCLY